MSKRAEERALEAYPQVWNEEEDRDVNYDGRCGFIEGYELAEKATIERAIAWLKEHANDYIVDLTPTYPDAPVNIVVGGMCWEHLRKAMEEEK